MKPVCNFYFTFKALTPVTTQGLTRAYIRFIYFIPTIKRVTHHFWIKMAFLKNNLTCALTVPCLCYVQDITYKRSTIT